MNALRLGWLVSVLSSISCGAWAQEQVAVYKKLSLQELMELEVTSVSRRPERLAGTASAIQVVTGEDIRRSGASSLPEALRLASNLNVAQINSSDWAISARGFNSRLSNKLLVMIDGRTVYTPLFAGVFWDVQHTFMEDIDRIEVISGPGGAQWGANAVNGVINITTKAAKDTQGLMLLGGGGTELRGFGGLRYGGELSPTLHYRVYVQHFERDGAAFPDGSGAGNDWQFTQSGLRLDWHASPENLLTVQGDLYDGRIQRPAPGQTEVSGGNLLGRWTHTISPDSSFSLQWYYDHTHRSIPDSISEQLTTHDVDFQHNFLLGERQHVIWGLGYRRFYDEVTNPTRLALLPADDNQEIYGGFLQDEITLVPQRLTLTLGTKIEHNDYTGWEIQPSTRLTWRATGNQTVWGAVSRAVRTPSRVDRDLYAPATPPFTALQGGSDFQSEKLIAYELGYRVQPTPTLSFSLATYYNDYDDIRSVEPASSAAPTPLVIRNGLKGHSYGAEFTADYRVTDAWRLQLGVTQMHLHLRPKSGSTADGSASSEANDWNTQVFLRSSHDLPGNVQFDIGVRHIGRIDRLDVPSYEEIDVRLGWQATPRLELSIVGQNLLNARHAEFGAPGARQEIERGVYAKLRWTY